MLIYRGKLNFGDYAVNEGITVMFPSGFQLGDLIYTFWQWTEMKDGRTKVKAFYNCVIDEATIISTGIKHLHFNNSDDTYYTFEASFSNGIDSLTLTIIGDDGYSGTANVSVVYQPDAPPSLFDSAPRLYIGKLTNFMQYAVDEMLLIVAPESMDKGNTICAFWQWTVNTNGDTKVNVDGVSTIQDVTWNDQEGESFKFTLGDGYYYKFDVRLYEVSKYLTYTMTGTNGESTGTLRLDLQGLEPSAPTRKKRAIVDHTTVVTNDSEEIVVCSLANSGTAVVDRILAVVLMAVAQVGIVASVVTMPASMGIWAAVIGWVVAIGGTVQVFNSSGEETSTTLFPGETMKRTSSGLAFSSDNDLHILLYRIKDLVLTVNTTTIEKTGNTTISLRDVLPGGKDAPEYKKLLPLKLPSDMSLHPYRVILIQGYGIDRPAKDLSDMQEKNIKNSLASYETSGSQPNWYGTMDDYYKTVIDASDNKDMFIYGDGHNLTLTLAPGQTIGDHVSILYIDLGEKKPKLPVLKFRHCTFVSGGRSPNSCSSDDDVVREITDNMSYKTFKYVAKNKWLVGISGVKDTKISYDPIEANCVYIVPDSFRPMQSLLDSSVA
ncbi:hypothetical protein V8E51_018044 [Hyaloscypha variabilis]